MNASDLREQIPALGFKEYWYPALKARTVGKKPVGLKLLGEDIVFFYVLYNWLRHHNFSRQGFRAMAPQRYDLPETLSATDAQVVAGRRLLLEPRKSPSQKPEPAHRSAEAQLASAGD